jgi:hypothetical protein
MSFSVIGDCRGGSAAWRWRSGEGELCPLHLCVPGTNDVSGWAVILFGMQSLLRGGGLGRSGFVRRGRLLDVVSSKMDGVGLWFTPT